MDYETVTFEVQPNGIATMTLNRPNQLNCFTQKMLQEWGDVISRCAYDNKIKVLVVTGAGRAFSSGVDITMLGSDRFDPAQFRYYYRQNHMNFDNLEALEKPVIAAINGLCYGGGVELALSCDILLGADDSTYCLVENHIGCIPATGACNRMIHYVGLGKTKELVINAKPIDAQEAWRIGLINHIVPARDLLKEAYTYAERLLDNAPFAMGMGKHVINLCLNTDMHTGRYIERLGQSVLVLSEDHKEGMQAFKEKRKPKFTGK
jgi:Enoyl-CoA hydratase/carnithine racemase